MQKLFTPDNVDSMQLRPDAHCICCMSRSALMPVAVPLAECNCVALCATEKLGSGQWLLMCTLKGLERNLLHVDMVSACDQATMWVSCTPPLLHPAQRWPLTRTMGWTGSDMTLLSSG